VGVRDYPLFFTCLSDTANQIRGQGSEVTAAVTAAHPQTSGQASSNTGVRFVVGGSLVETGELICDQAERGPSRRSAGG